MQDVERNTVKSDSFASSVAKAHLLEMGLHNPFAEYPYSDTILLDGHMSYGFSAPDCIRYS